MTRTRRNELRRRLMTGSAGPLAAAAPARRKADRAKGGMFERQEWTFLGCTLS